MFTSSALSSSMSRSPPLCRSTTSAPPASARLTRIERPTYISCVSSRRCERMRTMGPTTPVRRISLTSADSSSSLRASDNALASCAIACELSSSSGSSVAPASGSECSWAAMSTTVHMACALDDVPRAAAAREQSAVARGVGGALPRPRWGGQGRRAFMPVPLLAHSGAQRGEAGAAPGPGCGREPVETTGARCVRTQRSANPAESRAK